LHYAVYSSQEYLRQKRYQWRLVQKLTSAGADISIRNHDGETPLELFQRNGGLISIDELRRIKKDSKFIDDCEQIRRMVVLLGDRSAIHIKNDIGLKILNRFDEIMYPSKIAFQEFFISEAMDINL
jgi:ankyrin repeat protein